MGANSLTLRLTFSNFIYLFIYSLSLSHVTPTVSLDFLIGTVISTIYRTTAPFSGYTTEENASFPHNSHQLGTVSQVEWQLLTSRSHL